MIYEPQEMDQTMCHTHKKYNKTSKCFIHTELAANDAFLDHTSKLVNYLPMEFSERTLEQLVPIVLSVC